MAVHWDLRVKNVFLGKWSWKGTFGLKMGVFWPSKMIFGLKMGFWGKMGVQRDFGLKLGFGENGHEKGLLG